MVVIVEDITPAAVQRPHPSASAPVRSGGAAARNGTDARGGRDTEEDEIDEALTLTNLKKLIKKQGGYASSLELNEVRKRGYHIINLGHPSSVVQLRVTNPAPTASRDI